MIANSAQKNTFPETEIHQAADFVLRGMFAHRDKLKLYSQDQHLQFALHSLQEQNEIPHRSETKSGK